MATLSNALMSRRNRPHRNRLRLLDVGDACLQHVEATLKHAVLSDGRHLTSQTPSGIIKRGYNVGPHS